MNGRITALTPSARFTMRYRTKSGAALTLYNLALAAVREIERAQLALGSTGFTFEEQTHHYSQFEIDRQRKEAAQ